MIRIIILQSSSGLNSDAQTELVTPPLRIINKLETDTYCCMQCGLRWAPHVDGTGRRICDLFHICCLGGTQSRIASDEEEDYSSPEIRNC